MAGLTLAGEPVLLDIDQDIEAIVNTRLRSFVWPSLHDHARSTISPFIPSDYDGDILRIPYGDYPEPRINEWIHPTGASRYGRGAFLVDEKTMAEIAKDAFGRFGTTIPSPPETWGSNANGITLRIDYGDEVFVQTVYVLDPLVVDHYKRTQLWIVPVVDIRHRYLQQSVRLEKEPGRTWQELIEALAEDFEESVVVPGSPSQYLGVPDPRAFVENYASSAVAIDIALNSIGLRCWLDNKQLVVQNANDAKNRLNQIFNQPDINLGGRSPETKLPDKVIVNGPKTLNYLDCESWNHEGSISSGTGDIPPPTIYSTHYVHDFPANSQYRIESEDARDQFVDALADLIDQWHHQPGMISAPGIRYWVDTTCLDYVSFHVNGVESVHTSAITLPPDFIPRVTINQWAKNFVLLPSSGTFVLRAPELGVPPATSNLGESNPDPGSAECEIYVLDDDALPVAAKADDDSEPEPVPVYNFFRQEIEGDHFFFATPVDKKLVVLKGDQKSNYRMRFTTNQKIVNRAVQVTAQFTLGINTIDNSRVEPGDTLTVLDPNNLWSNIEPNATGWAYYRPPTPDDPSTPGINEFQPARWEIEECSLPINEVSVLLEADCLKAFQSSGFGRVFEILSDYPNVDRPPEFVESPPGQFQLPFENPRGLDAIRNSYVYLKRVTNQQPSDPDNLDVPKARSTTSERWEVESVQQPIARWVKVTLPSQSAGWEITDFWEGGDPRLCGSVTIECALDCSCAKDGTTGVACYDPQADKYVVISTESALLGKPDGVDIAHTLRAEPKLKLKYIEQPAKVFFCNQQPEEKEIEWPTTDCEEEDGSEGCVTYYCVWKWFEATSQWSKISSCCPGENCSPPSRNGNFDGETEVMPCS